MQEIETGASSIWMLAICARLTLGTEACQTSPILALSLAVRLQFNQII